MVLTNHRLLYMDEKKYDKPFDEFQDFNKMGEYLLNL